MPTNMLMKPIERSQGCWNCVHYAPVDLVKQLWAAHRARLLGARDENSDVAVRLRGIDARVDAGLLGACLKGRAESDFVEHAFLCEGGWTGRQGVSVVRATKLDATTAELRDLLGLPPVS